MDLPHREAQEVPRAPAPAGSAHLRSQEESHLLQAWLSHVGRDPRRSETSRLERFRPLEPLAARGRARPPREGAPIPARARPPPRERAIPARARPPPRERVHPARARPSRESAPIPARARPSRESAPSPARARPPPRERAIPAGRWPVPRRCGCVCLPPASFPFLSLSSPDSVLSGF